MASSIQIAVLSFLAAIGVSVAARAEDAHWSGFYLGGDVGGSWLRDVSSTSISPLNRGPFFADGWPPIAAVSSSGATGSAGDPSLSLRFGGLAPVGAELLAGGEFEASYARQTVNFATTGAFHRYLPDASLLTAFYDSADAAAVHLTTDWSMSWRAKAGYLLSDATMLFAAVGPILQHASAIVTHSASGTNSVYYGMIIPPAQSYFSTPFSTTSSASAGRDLWGVSVGGGVEQRLFGNFRLRTELTYNHYATWRLSPPNAASATGSDSYSCAPSSIAARVGLVYGF